MTDPVYDKLVDALNARTGYPCLKCPELIAVLEFLFTPQEAELAAKLPMNRISAKTLARDISGNPKAVESVLESMADKGLVTTQKIEEVRDYVLIPLLPGTFEIQLMRGETDERAKKLARLFQNYFDATRQAETPAPRTYTAVPFARVITVEEEVPAGVKIHPYDKVSEYIAQADSISVGTCYCRHFAELLGNDPCDRPKENCFSFGTQAEFLIERGFNKPVSKEKALKILDEAEKAGLVHCSSNTSEYISFMCNCCSCHCGILRSIVTADRPNSTADSSFIMSVDEEECIGCGDCVERCQVSAITMEGEQVVRDAERCIGCGLCVSACTTGALRLIPREKAPVPPPTQQELSAAMIASRQQQGAR